MKFAVITHVPHIKEGGKYYAYAPYVREMDIWSKHIGQLIVAAPLISGKKSAIDECYDHPDVEFRKIKSFDLLSIKGKVKALVSILGIIFEIFRTMQKADHIHLRCPGNIGLLGCFVQILFPSKPKSAKYAGNWDPTSHQPWTYRLQKRILSNTFLTKNMQVLVYGQWENQSKNIKPFFTATYSERDREEVYSQEIFRFFDPSTHRQAQGRRSSGQAKIRESTGQGDGVIRLLFVGTLTRGKRPLYAVRLAEELLRKGHKVQLDLYGEGAERSDLENYVKQNDLSDIVCLKGNQKSGTVKKAYQESHFMILPSQSEGWPKAVAEAMFWGCVPVSAPVSCIPWMMGHGQRGILLDMEVEADVKKIMDIWNKPEEFAQMGRNAANWSQRYTVDLFEREIAKLLANC